MPELNEENQIPTPSEGFGKVPNGSESFRTVRKASAGFRSVPKLTERNENHTLTVREVARMFEVAGVARTERSIINWCQFNAQGDLCKSPPDGRSAEHCSASLHGNPSGAMLRAPQFGAFAEVSQGVARFDAYFDPNERKYFITPQSVELAIAEEKARAAKNNTVSEAVGSVPNGSEDGSSGASREPEAGLELTAVLEKQVMDLKILHSGKDYLIQQLRQERDGFFNQLLDASRKVGQLETRLLQLKEPASESVATEHLP